MSSSKSREVFYKVLGSCGGEGEKYWRSVKINGIKARYNKDCIESFTFQVDDGPADEVEPVRNDGKKHFKVQLEDGEEHITYFGGYFKKVEVEGSEDPIEVIASLTFGTNKNRTLVPIGTESGKPFSLPSVAGKIMEFSRRVTEKPRLTPTSILARVEPTPEDSRSVKEKSVTSIGPFGGGLPWNDGIFKDVKEINLLFSGPGIRYIRFVYDIGGKTDIEVMHPEGVSREEDREVTVRLDYPNEYFTSISGHMRDNGSIQALEFYTNLKGCMYGNREKGKYFWYPSTGANKIVGFHGTCGETLNSIGVYVEPIRQPSPKKESPMESSGGTEWDDGENSHVIGYRVTDGPDGKNIESITFMYHHDGSSVKGSRHGGGRSSSGKWIMLNFPEERLTLLTGYVRKEGHGPTTIHNLELCTTSGERATRLYAEKFDRHELQKLKMLRKKKESGKKLEKDELRDLKELKKLEVELEGSNRFQIPEQEGRRIAGFFGKAGECLHSIGAYVGSY